MNTTSAKTGEFETNPALVVRGISKAFGGNLVLQNVDLTLSRGEIVAVIGPNGSGKTTLFNILSGHLGPDRGTVTIYGKSIYGLRPNVIARTGIGRTFQDVRVFQRMTVRDNVKVACARLAQPGPARKSIEGCEHHERAIDEILDRMMIRHREMEIAETLSYGQKKLLSLAICIASNPSVFLLDEPFAGVQFDVQQIIMRSLQELRDRGKAIAFIEHDTDVVFTLANRVVVLAGGKTIASGIPANVRREPIVLSAYLGECHVGED